ELSQVAGDELPLELKSDEEEEDREQPIGRPGADAETQVPRLVADFEIPEGEVGLRPWRIGPKYGESGECHQQDATDGLFAEDLGDPKRFRPGRGWEDVTDSSKAGGEFCHQNAFGSSRRSSSTRLPDTPPSTLRHHGSAQLCEPLNLDGRSEDKHFVAFVEHSVRLRSSPRP